MYFLSNSRICNLLDLGGVFEDNCVLDSLFILGGRYGKLYPLSTYSLAYLCSSLAYLILRIA